MRIAYLCPGQGNQHRGMLELLADDPTASATLDAVSSRLGQDIRQLVTDPAIDLYANALAQPLICAVQLATACALATRLPAPMIVAGYSIGEVAAHAVAGALDALTLIDIACHRAALMDAAQRQPAGMLALAGRHRSFFEQLALEHGAYVAIVNGDDHVIIGGEAAALAKVQSAARHLGVTTVRELPVAVAAHTPLLTEAAATFSRYLATESFGRWSCPVLAGISAAPVQEKAQAVTTLSAQLCQPVLWADLMTALDELKPDIVIELGPGNSLARMLRQATPALQVRAASEFRSLDGVADWAMRLAG